MGIHRRRRTLAQKRSDKFISERTIIYCVSGMGMIVRYGSYVRVRVCIGYTLLHDTYDIDMSYSTSRSLWAYASITTFAFAFVVVDLFFSSILSCVLACYFFFVPFCPLAFKSPYLRIQCERSSQQCICVCECGDFFMVSLIRIFKVYTHIFVNDDVIARMQVYQKRLTHFFFVCRTKQQIHV